MSNRLKQRGLANVAEKFIQEIRHHNDVAPSNISGLKDLTEDEYRMLVFRLVDSFGRGFDEIGRLMTRLYQSSIGSDISRPPLNAEYVLFLLLPREEMGFVIGDLIESYGAILSRFNKRRADIWFYKQVIGSLLPLLRRALLRVAALIWLGRIFRRFIS